REEDGVGGQKGMPLLEALDLAPRAELPRLGGTVAAGGDDASPLAVEGGGEDGVVVSAEDPALQDAGLFVIGDCPQQGPMIVAGGDDGPPVGRKGAGLNPTVVTAEGLERPPRVGVPDFDGVVVAPREDHAAVLRETHRADRRSVPLKGPERDRLALL